MKSSPSVRVLGAALGLGLGLLLLSGPSAPASALDLSVRPFTDLNQRQSTGLGTLTLREGAILSSEDPAFGGFSALEWVDGAWLAAGDRGHWLGFSWRDGDVDVHRWQPIPIDRRALKNRGSATDAEALTIAADGSLLLAFEREHRIQRHPGLDARPDSYEVPIALRAPAPLNSGIEAMTTLADGSIFAVTEKVKRDGGFRAYRITGSRGQNRELYVYTPEDDWLPSAATTLPDGTLLIVERRVTIFGFRARFVTLDPAQLTGVERARITPKPLAKFSIGSLPSDNIEGIHARDLGEGRVEIVTISDDNFKGYQSTKLLRFELVLDQQAAAPQVKPKS